MPEQREKIKGLTIPQTPFVFLLRRHHLRRRRPPSPSTPLDEDATAFPCLSPPSLPSTPSCPVPPPLFLLPPPLRSPVSLLPRPPAASHSTPAYAPPTHALLVLSLPPPFLPLPCVPPPPQPPVPPEVVEVRPLTEM